MDYLITKLQNYLYSIDFAAYDYDKAREYYRTADIQPGACSAIRKGNLYGRNFDYPYTNLAEFVVYAEPSGKHKSVGIASSISGLTKDVVESEEFTDAFDIIPFATVDGINDAGVVCNVNVVPGDYGHATGTNPDAEETIYTPMVVRYILDNADSAYDAVNKLQNVNIVNSGRVPYDVHWMIADADETYILEYIDGELTFVDDQEIMTNFYNYGFDGNTATAFYKSDDYDSDDTTLTTYASGLERYDILAEGYDDATDVKSMRNLLNMVKYTKTYTDGEWLSEFCGNNGDYGDLTINSSSEDFDDILARSQHLYGIRKRNGVTWQTMHSSVYNIEKKKLYVVSQENNKEFIFDLNRKKDKSMNLFKRAANIFAKHDVPIENGDLPEGILTKEDYDPNNDVSEIGGIPAYVEDFVETFAAGRTAENIHNINNPTTATAEEIATKVNAILDALVDAGLMVAGADPF